MKAKLLIVHGESGAGKTRYLKRYVENNGMYLHADTLNELLLQYVKKTAGENMLHPAKQLLTLDLKRFAFDDIDFQFRGRSAIQELVFEMLKGLTDGGRSVAIGVLCPEEIPTLMKRIDEEYKKEEIKWVEL